MTLNDLTINPQSINTESLLEDWEWLLKENSRVVLITAMGDLFLQGESGAIYFLDVCSGTLKAVCENGQEFEDSLSNVTFVTEHFYPSLIFDYRKNGLTLNEGECYSHKQFLVLGGKDTIENIEPTNAEVHISMLGQIHYKLKDLPAGTVIKDIIFKDR